MGVREVGSRVGYSSEEAFSRAFKRAFGRSPAYWRVAAEPAREPAATDGRGRPLRVALRSGETGADGPETAPFPTGDDERGRHDADGRQQRSNGCRHDRHAARLVRRPAGRYALVGRGGMDRSRARRLGDSGRPGPRPSCRQRRPPSRPGPCGGRSCRRSPSSVDARGSSSGQWWACWCCSPATCCSVGGSDDSAAQNAGPVAHTLSPQQVVRQVVLTDADLKGGLHATLITVVTRSRARSPSTCAATGTRPRRTGSPAARSASSTRSASSPAPPTRSSSTTASPARPRPSPSCARPPRTARTRTSGTRRRRTRCCSTAP